MSSFNRKKQQDKDKPKSLADIGLGDIPLPLALTTSKAQRQEMKRLDKKKSVQNTQNAIDFLSDNRTEVEKHREQIKQIEKQEKMEKALLKRERREEHRTAQETRDRQAKLDEQKTIQYQKEIQKEIVEHKMEEAQRQALEQKMIDHDNEARAKLAPKAIHVPVNRKPEIIAVRETLPVRHEEQQIMEAILDPGNDCVLIAGETGSGKTSQIPQFLWEAGFGQPEGESAGRNRMIAVTEPRRVAAVAMARRVAEELNEPFGGTVCYSVRYSNNMSPDCRMKFMTEGVLLRELQNDLLLSNYSAVVVDEAHERSISCDVLLGMLSRIVKLRKEMSIEKPGQVYPLHLVIMSATLRISDFRDNRTLFPRPPPLIDIPVRRFPVHNHFSRKTELNKYVDEAYKKVKQIHKKLPPGGVLVFLSTQREIETLQKKLNDHYSETRVFLDHFKVRAKRRAEIMEAEEKEQEEENNDNNNTEDAATTANNNDENNKTTSDDNNNDNNKKAPATTTDDYGYASEDYDLDDFKPSSKKNKGSNNKRRGRRNYDDDEDESAAAREVDDDLLAEQEVGSDSEGSNEDAESDREEEDDERGEFDTMYVLPLYAMLSQDAQHKVFQEPPPGKRLCVIATNIAETSITIPNIRYVVDAGRVRSRRLGPDGVDRYQVEMVSQASAEQRSGRAGRTAPGHCYRLYTPAVYANLMPKHNDPEILRVPLDSVVIMMKSMRIDNVRKFPFPAAPSPVAIESAMRHLQRIGALHGQSYRCTDVGHRIGHYPVAPRLARMLLAIEGVIVNSNNSTSNMSCEAQRKLQVFSNNTTTSNNTLQQQLRLLQEALISIVAVVTAGLDPFLTSESQIQKQWQHPGSDFVTLLVAFTWFSSTNARKSPAKCTEHGIMYKLMTESMQLRKQLEQCFNNSPGSSSNNNKDSNNNNNNNNESTTAVEDYDNEEGATTTVVEQTDSNKNQQQKQNNHNNMNNKSSLDLLSHFKLPFNRQLDEQIRRLVCVGLVDQVCRRADPEQCKKFDVKYTSTQKCGKTPYWDVLKKRIVFVHSRSTVSSVFPAPDYLVYTVASSQERGSSNTFVNALIQGGGMTASNNDDAAEGGNNKQQRIFIRGVTSVTREWLDLAGFVDPDEHKNDVDHEDDV